MPSVRHAQIEKKRRKVVFNLLAGPVLSIQTRNATPKQLNAWYTQQTARTATQSSGSSPGIMIRKTKRLIYESTRFAGIAVRQPYRPRFRLGRTFESLAMRNYFFRTPPRARGHTPLDSMVSRGLPC